MAVLPSDWESILQYIKELMTLDKYKDRKLDPEFIEYILTEFKDKRYESWKEWKSNQKRTKRVPATGEYGEQWERLWQLWPSMRTFTYKGRKFECQKPFKSNEALCMQKYIDILKTDKVSPEVIYRAAETALAWCMENSYRKGRNEMEFMNGLQPWLNQKQYRNWLEVAMPGGEFVQQLQKADTTVDI